MASLANSSSAVGTEEINSFNLMKKAKTFFRKNGLLINWKEFDLNLTEIHSKDVHIDSYVKPNLRKKYSSECFALQQLNGFGHTESASYSACWWQWLII